MQDETQQNFEGTGATRRRGLSVWIVVVAILAVSAVVFWLFYTPGADYGRSGEDEPVTPDRVVTYEQCVEAGNPVMESFPEQCVSEDGLHFINWRGAGQFCAQVVTNARNPETGEVWEFPTPCDVPTDWEPTEFYPPML